MCKFLNKLEQLLEKLLKKLGVSLTISVKFILFIILLTFLGMLMQHKVTILLNDVIEQHLMRQAATLSKMTEERFKREFMQFEYWAQSIEAHQRNVEDLSNRLKNMQNDLETRGLSVGFLSIKDTDAQNQMLSGDDFKRLHHAFLGNKVIDYCKGKGLLFAYPIYNNIKGDNVKYVAYRLYHEEVLTKLFGLEEYENDSYILIQDNKGQVIIPYKNYGESDEQFFSEENISDGFFKIRERLRYNKTAALYVDSTKGKYFLFGADIPQTNLKIIGYTPWSVVAGTISRANGLVLIVTSLMLLLFLVTSIYLFMLNEKAKQSDEFKREKQEADQANQAKSAFLANMSHEIRTPINAVIGMNEMILRECNDSTILKYARNVAQASETLLSLINDILDFSKIESGKMELVEEKYKLDDLIKGLINMIKPRAEKKNLTFNVKIDEDLPNELFGDSTRIRQIIVNFLTNAVKYTLVGGVKFIVEKEKESANEIILKFSVIDTGIGIRNEDKGKLFQDFERFDSKKNKNIEGTGLGLAITYKLVNMMHGWIKVDSVYGEGSVFTVMMPQKIMGTSLIGNFAEKMAHEKVRPKEYKTSFIAPDAKILVVDDNEMNLLVVTSLLKQTKIKIDTAMSGMSALKKLANTSYDLIFLDQMMPSLDGIQTLHLAKEMPDNKSQGVPTIALTANAISGAKEMFLNEGFTDYLSKPIDSHEMEQMLIKYLPAEKLQTPVEDETPQTDNEPVQEDTNNYEYLNVELGLQYSANMLDMYKNILSMFCKLKNEKQSKIQEAYDNENWQDYTTFIHALKSTSLSVGGEKTSAAAKQLETAGKIIISNASSELDKQQSIEYIKQHHEEAMQLYDLLVNDGNQFLNVDEDKIETKPVESIENDEANANIENTAVEESVSNDAAKSTPSQTYENINTELGVHECSDIPEVYAEMLRMFCEDKDNQQKKLKQAFDENNWQDYISIIQELATSAYTIGGEKLSKLLKSIETAGKMLTSDFTSETEKQQSMDYIKQNHEEAMQLYDALVSDGNQFLGGSTESYENINTELGVHECSDIPEVYAEMLRMFCEDKDNQQKKLKQAFDENNWQDYISIIQELATSAYTIGGEKLSKLLKSIETAGKMLTSDFTSETEKQQSMDYIKQNHEEAMQLYDSLVDEGLKVIESI